MKKLNITRSYYENSNYFTKKYGSLKYMSESGDKYKTDKGFVLVLEEDDNSNQQNQNSDNNNDSQNNEQQDSSQDDSWMGKIAKKAWGKAKEMMVSAALSGCTPGVSTIIPMLGTLLEILDKMPGFDKKPYEDKLKQFNNMGVEGVKGIEATIKNIPVIGDILESDVESLSNIIRFYVFSLNVATGLYPGEKINIAKWTAALGANGLAIASWVLFIVGTVEGAVAVEGTNKGKKRGKQLVNEVFGVGLGTALGMLIKEFGADISAYAFKWVNDDLLAFESWCKDNGKDLEGMKKAVGDGTAKAPENKNGGDQNDQNDQNNGGDNSAEKSNDSNSNGNDQENKSSTNGNSNNNSENNSDSQNNSGEDNTISNGNNSNQNNSNNDGNSNNNNQTNGDQEKQQTSESIKILNISTDFYKSSKYFNTKYGTLKYVSESGNLYKTSKGKVLMFN